MTDQEKEDQEKEEVIVDTNSDAETEMEEGSELDIVEIIEELPHEGGEEEDQFDLDPNTSSMTSSSGNSTRPSAHEFSLSSIGFALAGTLTEVQSATASLHSNTVKKLQQSLSQIQMPAAAASPRELSESSSRGSGSRASLRAKFGPRQPSRKVDFGPFEARAVRLQYTQEDIFNIADDPQQFDDLRQALRSLGAITNTMLKQKLHWYVKNSKRARQQEEERRQRQRELEEEEERKRQQLEQEAAKETSEAPQSQLEPCTPPTEYRVVDGQKVMESVVAPGVINPEDPSPTSVRGIFVPPS